MYNFKVRAKNLVKKTDEIYPSRIAQVLKIFVKRVDKKQLPRQVKGFIKTIKRRKYIVVDGTLPPLHQEAIIAHELGHYVLHKGYSAFSMDGRYFSSKTKKEAEADAFAVELLSVGLDINKDYIVDFLQCSNNN